MIRALVFAAACVVSTSALAAPPEFCERYARDAVHEFRSDEHIPMCFHGENARWNDHYEGHFNWCLHHSREEAEAEIDYRRARLHECHERLHY